MAQADRVMTTTSDPAGRGAAAGRRSWTVTRRTGPARWSSGSTLGSVVGWGPSDRQSLRVPLAFTLYGHYVGWTISGTDLPWDLVELAVDFDMGREVVDG